jgi:chromosome transmission fidelity protein 18
LSDKADII